MIWMTSAAWIVARVCLVCMFPFSAAEKVWHWKNGIDQTRQTGYGPTVAAIMLGAAVAVEAITPFMIVFGWFDRIGAILLAGFCFVTAFLYHPFWKAADLWSADPASKGRAHFWDFTKNFGLVGGLLLVVFAGTLSAPGSLAHPWTWLRSSGR